MKKFLTFMVLLIFTGIYGQDSKNVGIYDLPNTKLSKEAKEKALRELFDKANAILHPSLYSLKKTDDDYAKAVEYCDAGIAMYPKPQKDLNGLFAQMYKLRAEGFKALGLYKRSLDDYNEAIKLYTLVPSLDASECYRGRGFILLIYMDRYKEAISDLNYSIQHDPTYYQHYYFRAVAYSKIGEVQKANEDLAMAKKLNPHDPLYKDITTMGSK